MTAPETLLLHQVTLRCLRCPVETPSTGASLEWGVHWYQLQPGEPLDEYRNVDRLNLATSGRCRFPHGWRETAADGPGEQLWLDPTLDLHVVLRAFSAKGVTAANVWKGGRGLYHTSRRPLRGSRAEFVLRSAPGETCGVGINHEADAPNADLALTVACVNVRLVFDTVGAQT